MQCQKIRVIKQKAIAIVKSRLVGLWEREFLNSDLRLKRSFSNLDDWRIHLTTRVPAYDDVSILELHDERLMGFVAIAPEVTVRFIVRLHFVFVRRNSCFNRCPYWRDVQTAMSWMTDSIKGFRRVARSCGTCHSGGLISAKNN